VIGASYLLLVLDSTSRTGDGNRFAEIKVQVYYSSGCGCCREYVRYLKGHGFYVDPVVTEDMEGVKLAMGVPRSLWSCHTSRIGEYFVEGHVPVEFIERLLREKPPIDGIALPGMPQGSPGMAGSKTQPFIIYSVSQGRIGEFGRS